jgi:phosphate transport system protein
MIDEPRDMIDEPREETRQSFHEVLDQVRSDTVALGALVLENTRRMADALLENQIDLAQQVIEADEEIDERYVELEHRVFEILARQQPVAGDLRFLVSITRMLYEIERSGDLAVNAAKGLIRRDGYTLPPAVQSLLARMARGAVDVFGQGLDALREMDKTAGPRLDKADDVVDALVGEFYAITAAQADDMGLELAVELSRVGRYLERIADHGVNIGEHITFIVTGEFPEGSPATSDEG